MKKTTLCGSLGVLALLCSSVGTAATITAVASNLNPAIGANAFTVTVSGSGFTNLGGGTVLLNFNPTVTLASSALAPGPFLTPIAGTIAISLPTVNLFPDSAVSGSFDIAVFTFNAVSAGAAGIVFSDDGGNCCGWFDSPDANFIPVTYVNPAVTVAGGPVVPAPATLWLLGSGLAGLVLRAKGRKRVVA